MPSHLFPGSSFMHTAHSWWLHWSIFFRDKAIPSILLRSTGLSRCSRAKYSMLHSWSSNMFWMYFYYHICISIAALYYNCISVCIFFSVFRCLNAKYSMPFLMHSWSCVLNMLNSFHDINLCINIIRSFTESSFSWGDFQCWFVQIKSNLKVHSFHLNHFLLFLSA